MVEEARNHVFVVLGDVCFNGCHSEYLNEDFHWICGKRTVIGGDVYMRLNGDEGTRAPSLCHCHMQK